MPTVSTFPCVSCGAELRYEPGTRELSCEHCRARNEIPAPAAPIEEQDYGAMLARLDEGEDHQDQIVVHCESCGADVPMQAEVTSRSCAFCGSNVVATGVSRKIIKPKSLLPFAVNASQSRELFVRWLKSLWFAPTTLKAYATMQGPGAAGLAGVYLPFWTYDARAVTPYTGQRGDHYFVQVPFTTIVNGKTVTQMRTERRTRWSWAGGTVEDHFDDVLVQASRSLPQGLLARIGAFDIQNLVPYADHYLAGFRAESYTIDLREGFDAAQGVMAHKIERSIRHAIGGDEQRIHSMSPAYHDVTFKHVLAPIWVAAYRYKGRVYRFLVNARSGQVSGERPYSGPKIALAILAALVVVGVIAFLASR